MLSSHDDYPIHQTPDPVNQPSVSDKNFYDRYWFNGYARDGEFYFAVALGLYPNRRVMDAGFSIVRNGVQHSLHASRLAPDDPCETRVGPLRIEVIEPMRTLRVTLEKNATDIEADLLFRPRTACVEEARAPIRRDRRLVMDTTRFTQFGLWEGSVLAHGETTSVTPERAYGTRDRSWGIRPVGEPEGGRPAGEPQFFFLWAPLQFEDLCTHAATMEDAEGQTWDNFAVCVPAYGSPQEIPGVEDPGVQRLVAFRHAIEWEPGTRWTRSGELQLLPASGEPHVIRRGSGGGELEDRGPRSPRSAPSTRAAGDARPLRRARRHRRPRAARDRPPRALRIRAPDGRGQGMRPRFAPFLGGERVRVRRDGRSVGRKTAESGREWEGSQ
jgi:hypothetical protein